jgi:hypothetical protein
MGEKRQTELGIATPQVRDRHPTEWPINMV